MRMIVIDGGMMPSKEEAHAYLAQKLSLPEYYGKNLDALFDVLTAGLEMPACLIIYRAKLLEESLGRYGRALLDVMTDASRDNPYLRVIFDGDEDC